MNPTGPSAPKAPPQTAAWLNSAAKVAGTGISFLLYIALARTMTPEGFADFALVFAWLALAASFATFSFPMVLVRYVPEGLSKGSADLARGVAQFSVAATTGLAVGVSALALIIAESGLVSFPRDLESSVVIAAALLIPSVALMNLAGFLTALKRAFVAELFVNVMRPALLVAALATLWFTRQPPFSTPLVLALYLGASLVMLLACVAYSLASVPPAMAHAKPAYAIRTWLRAAWGFMAAIFMAALSERVDLIVLGFTAAPADVATYAVAARFSQTVAIAANAAAVAMAPHVVECLEDLRGGRREGLQALVRDTARTSLYISLIAFAAFGALGPLFLSLFGPHYEGAYAPLMILAAGQVLACLFGPAAGIATLAGAPRVAILGLLAGIVVNVALNIALVPLLGVNGAALATATGMFSAAAITWGWTRRRFLLDTSVLGVAQR